MDTHVENFTLLPSTGSSMTIGMITVMTLFSNTLDKIFIYLHTVVVLNQTLRSSKIQNLIEKMTEELEHVFKMTRINMENLL